MNVWVFAGANATYALSSDETGANLPPDLGPWHGSKPYRLDPELHDDEREAARLIEQHGFVCF